MSKATISQCLAAINGLALDNQQRHEDISQKIVALETNINLCQNEITQSKEIIEDSKEEAESIKTAYNSLEASFEQFKTTIFEKINTILTSFEDIKLRSMLDTDKPDASTNTENGSRSRKRLYKSKSVDGVSKRRRQNDTPILYKYIHRRINLQLENQEKQKNGTLGPNEHVLSEYLYDIAHTPQESRNPQITANYVVLYTREWTIHKERLRKYLTIISILIYIYKVLFSS